MTEKVIHCINMKNILTKLIKTLRTSIVYIEFDKILSFSIYSDPNLYFFLSLQTFHQALLYPFLTPKYLKFISKLFNPINSGYITNTNQSFDSFESITLKIIFNSFLLNIRITIFSASVITSEIFTIGIVVYLS